MPDWPTTCCRCHTTPTPPPPDHLANADKAHWPSNLPVPEGWYPDPESDNGMVCFDCATPAERHERAKLRETLARVGLGEMD